MSYDNMLQKALKLHQQGNFDEAEKLYRQILQTTPDHPQVLNLIGLIAQSKALHEEAITYFEKSILKDFENFELFSISVGRSQPSENITKPLKLLTKFSN